MTKLSDAEALIWRMRARVTGLEAAVAVLWEALPMQQCIEMSATNPAVFTLAEECWKARSAGGDQ